MDITLNKTIKQVIKVLKSCKTEEQLDCSINWAVEVISTRAKECNKEPINSRGKIYKHLAYQRGKP